MKKNEYDVIIIGAGIGGLICGCYLTKAGKKVLIVEKNKIIGGYCRSFVYQDSLHFDACVHSLASCREEGTFGEILDNLGIRKKLSLRQSIIPNLVIFGDKKIRFFRDVNETIEEFVHYFRKEENNIRKFFHYIARGEKLSFILLKQKTFSDLLNSYFDDNSLKKIISEMILISTGVFPSNLSAFVGCSTLREYVFDAGYYPKRGIQGLPNILADNIRSSGGEINTSEKVKKIIIQRGSVSGVETNKGLFYKSNTIVSSCDFSQTFKELISDKEVNLHWNKELENMVPSMSSFCLYLAVDRKPGDCSDFKSTVYLMDSEKSLQDTYCSIKSFDNSCFILSSPSSLSGYRQKKETFLILANAFFMNREFWRKKKDIFADRLLKKIKRAYPDLVANICFKKMATPQTLQEWTLNYKGASYGWASIPGQIGDPRFRGKTKINGLYIAGHWMTLAHGVISAAYSGKRTAKTILLRSS